MTRSIYPFIYRPAHYRPAIGPTMWVQDESSREWKLIPVATATVETSTADGRSTDVHPYACMEVGADAVATVVSTSDASAAVAATVEAEPSPVLSGGIAATLSGFTAPPQPWSPSRSSTAARARTDCHSHSYTHTNAYAVPSEGAATAEGPPRATAPATAGMRYHRVLPTDTFQGICLRYKVAPAELRRANKMTTGSTNLLLLPEKLIIPSNDKNHRAEARLSQPYAHANAYAVPAERAASAASVISTSDACAAGVAAVDAESSPVQSSDIAAIPSAFTAPPQPWSPPRPLTATTPTDHISQPYTHANAYAGSNIGNVRIGRTGNPVGSIGYAGSLGCVGSGPPSEERSSRGGGSTVRIGRTGNPVGSIGYAGSLGCVGSGPPSEERSSRGGGSTVRIGRTGNPVGSIGCRP